MTTTKIFLSWSGARSLRLATALKDGLQILFPEADFVISSEDMSLGVRWSQEIGRQLAESNTGIICVTPENVDNPWLLFEAGALSKSIQDSRVIPCCFDMRVADLSPPMGQFQSMEADRDGIGMLVTRLCDIVDPQVKMAKKERALGLIMRSIDEISRVVPPSLPHVSDLLPFGEFGETRYRGSHERIRRTRPDELVKFLAVTGYGLFKMPGAGQPAGYVEALRRGSRIQGVVMDPESPQARERMAVETPDVPPENSLLAVDAEAFKIWLTRPDPSRWPNLGPDRLKHIKVRYTSSALTFGMVLFEDIAFIEPLHLGRVDHQPHLCGFSVIRAPYESRDYDTASRYFAYLYEGGTPVN